MGRIARLWPIILILFLASSCAVTQEIVIEDRTVAIEKMEAGKAYEAPIDGWFVSDEALGRLISAIEYFRYRYLECKRRRGM